MNAEKFARTKAAFLEIADLAAADRAARLAALAASDEDLAREVGRWLAKDDGWPIAERQGYWSARPDSADAIGDEGRRLGDFVLVRPLGRGGMGEVWEAIQSSVRRPVALKLMRSDARRSPGALRRFRREAEAAGRLEHPAIVHVIAAGEADGVPYIAQDLIPEGRSLARACTHGAVAAADFPGHCRRVAEIIATIAEALQTAHEHGVLHRDVKPSNILIGADGQPRLCDFGVAHLDDAEAPTMTGSLVGTPHYMSPEMVDPRWGPVGPRADVFSLGVTLFECLTGSKPFDGASAHQVMRATLDEDPADPRRLVASVPADLAAICLKSLEKEQGQRYVDAAALAADLRRWLRGEPVVARPLGPVGRAVKWIRRHPAWTTAAAALLLGFGVSLTLVVRLAQRQGEISRLALAEEMQRLREEADALWPVSAADESRLVAWLEDARRLLAQEEVIRALYRESEGAATEEATADMGSAWWHRVLRSLLEEFEEFRDPRSGWMQGISPRHGIGIARRLELARALRERSATGEYRAAWEKARAEIGDPGRCPQYRGFTLPEQEGLMPLRRDPRSGLWEFADLRTGEAPVLDPGSDTWRIEEATGMVFVLLPPIEFVMGAQNEDPGAPNYAEHARKHELGLIPLRLDPFLLSKYEMTQGQWQRQTGGNPSYYAPQDPAAPQGERFHPYQVDLRHPIEHVSLRAAEELLRRLGMELPTGAQWEAVARVGFNGDFPPEDWLRDGANLFDQTAMRATGNPGGEPWDDGHWLHAPVGSFTPNPLGLHDLFGNVGELVSDPFTYELSELAPQQGSGRASVAHPQTAVVRGGVYSATRGMSRVSMRRSTTSTAADSGTGLRPVRSIQN